MPLSRMNVEVIPFWAGVPHHMGSHGLVFRLMRGESLSMLTYIAKNTKQGSVAAMLTVQRGCMGGVTGNILQSRA